MGTNARELDRPSAAEGSQTVSHKACSRCVMNETDSQLILNEAGICNHCLAYDATMAKWNLPERIAKGELAHLLNQIKSQGKNQEYDCVMGLSGGVDSSYVAHLAHEAGLRPLCVHLDNGWNSELAVANIHSICERLGFTLYTHVIDWQEFRDLQRSFFAAHVVDIELLTDHAIFGVILQLARKHNIKAILSGANLSTEFVMPKTWVHRKQDLPNIRSIHKKFGARPLRTFPQVSTLSHLWGMFALGYRVHKPLNLIDYNKAEAKKLLQNRLGWRDYGGKHHESLFTKFYQNHILPVKFGIDKRRAHLSSLILSGQITREAALAELQEPLYNSQQLAIDTEYVCKKLGYSAAEMQTYLSAPARPHSDFSSDGWWVEPLMRLRG